MKNPDSIFKTLELNIDQSTFNPEAKSTLLNNLNKLKHTKLNIMITGATGAGKSSTINALFNMATAKVGIGCDPETTTIMSYTLNNLVLWDTAGLGDGRKNDRRHAINIKEKLRESDSNGKPLIDLVLVIIDGGTRDLGTSAKLINEVIIPCLGPNPSERILVAINQADVALKGPDAWNHDLNKPTVRAEQFLNEKVSSIKMRIKEATNISTDPIFYVAGHTDDHTKQKPYNLSKLLFLIISHLPQEKRVILADRTISEDPQTWFDDDKQFNYMTESRQSLWDAIVASTTKGADIGEDIGSLLGSPGRAIGRLIGGTIGAISGGFFGFFGF
ncbi:MAG: putative GTPase [Cocleimonas sp.]|jgi:predicted GTPase